MERTAYVDESVRGPSGLPIYVMAAVSAAGQPTADVRLAARELAMRGQSKVHWHAESDGRRVAIAADLLTR